MTANSYCTYQASVDVYWRYCPADEEEVHKAEIVDAVFAALSGEGRVWSPWARHAVLAELRDRIDRASVGALVPVDHVKSLRGGRTGLFEIRWKDVAVAELGDGGRLRYYKTGARLIHAEPDELGIAMLGLVAHEKAQDEGAKAEQDLAIDEAEVIFNGGYPNLWGVSPRSGSQS